MHLVKFCQYDSKYLSSFTNLLKKHRFLQLFLQTNMLICLKSEKEGHYLILDQKNVQN